MEAHARYIRQSPRKVRPVANLIRGLTVPVALAQLSTIKKAARTSVEKTLRSAIANAENAFQKNRDTLFVKEIRVDEGPDYKRWRPRAFGRAAPILKHSCHISIALGERPGAAPSVLGEAVVPVPSDDTIASSTDTVLPLSDEISPVDGTQLPPKEIFDKTRKGRHETAQIVNVKEQKKSRGFIKTIFQRKTG